MKHRRHCRVVARRRRRRKLLQRRRLIYEAAALASAAWDYMAHMARTALAPQRYTDRWLHHYDGSQTGNPRAMVWPTPGLSGKTYAIGKVTMGSIDTSTLTRVEVKAPVSHWLKVEPEVGDKVGSNVTVDDNAGSINGQIIGR